MKTFATLSPIPRFRKWLQEKIRSEIEGTNNPSSSILEKEEYSHLASLFDCATNEVLPHFLAVVDSIANDDQFLFTKDDKYEKRLKPIFMRLAAFYLLHEKHHGKPLDGVAKFHLRNGAELYRLNWLADVSRKGMHNSLGIMVNYRYCLDDIEENHFLFEREGHIKTKDGVLKWLNKESFCDTSVQSRI